jgi:hypothetical protein
MQTPQEFHSLTKVRRAQVEVAEAYPRGAWVDTDDLNGPTNDLHYTQDGYRELGVRLATEAVALIKRMEKMEPRRKNRYRP